MTRALPKKLWLKGRSRKLRPAELKDERYALSYSELNVRQLWCGKREVWTRTHGWASRYHVMVDGGVAACRSQEGWRNRSVIVLCHLVPIAKVLNHMRCQRNGCRQIFDKFLTP